MDGITRAPKVPAPLTKIPFKRMYLLQNGKMASKKNMNKIVAISKEVCTNIHGVAAIEAAKAAGIPYYKTYRIHKEPEGYIFWEINAHVGICGHHKTIASLIWHSLPFVDVYIED